MLFFVFPPYLGGMSTYDETVALCALNKIFGYHPHLALDLMEQNGSALALFDGKLAAEAPLADAQVGRDVFPSAKKYADATGNTYGRIRGRPEGL